MSASQFLTHDCRASIVTNSYLVYNSPDRVSRFEGTTMSMPAKQSALPQAPPWLPNLLSVVRIAVGLLFFQHGAEKLWGFANGRVDYNFGTLHGMAGPIEVTGGALLILGLFTRTTAFILCGEM